MNRIRPLRAALLLVVLSLSCATTRNHYESRLELLALLQTLNANLLTSSSATVTLERWCGQHHLAANPTVIAQRVAGVEKPPTAEQLQRLRVPDASAVKYRRVRLQCGAHTLSEADNWYVPARLTAEMNQLLDTTDTPFGKAVRPLMPYRRTIEAKLLWSPLPQGWERGPRPRLEAVVIPKEVLVHIAVLYTADHEPFSEVVETYQGALFAFRTSAP